MTPLKPFIRTSSIPHSLWQSAVQKTIYNLPEHDGKTLNYNGDKVKFHPMKLGANLHIHAHNEKKDVKAFDSKILDKIKPTDIDMDPKIQAFLSKLFFNHANSLLKDKIFDAIEVRLDELKKRTPLSIIGFPVSDYTYEFWLVAIINYYINHGFRGSTKHQQYKDWKIAGKGNEAYGVIDYKLSPDAKVVILGDYGTGLPDAIAFLEHIMTTLQPDCIIHVGDVYYSGTEHECKTEILDVFLDVFNKVGKSVPLFSIPGNHEYMSGGQGFYKHVLDVNNQSGQPESTYQEASYFCLRTADDKWQFLGMDTGFNSLPTPMPTIGPDLQESEKEWHRNKLEHFDGKTILLSHHQLFSVNALINAKKFGGSPYLNDHLHDLFCPFFEDIAAWFWGHEHSLGIFTDGVHGLSKGRLVGNSGFEEFLGEGPYEVNNPDKSVSYQSPIIKVDTTTVDWLFQSHEWYNHACALIDFSNSLAPEVTYYQFPVWVEKNKAPESPKLTEITNAKEYL
ncbi:MAG: metallophosphoesterase [Saprospiraceae bacterium]|nr:metallophosphoesterase [Saprospiraceae bacterium]